MATKGFFRAAIGWTPQDVNDRVSAAQSRLVNRWLQLTGTLRSSLTSYQAAMNVTLEPRSILLEVGAFPALARMVERGASPWVLQNTVLNANSKVSKAGHRYANVPFRHTTRELRAYANKIYEKARALTSKQRLPAGLVAKLDPYHVTDPLAALKRVQAPGGGNQYMTWRTISEAGRPWVHGGIKGRHFTRQVAEEAQAIVAPLFEPSAAIPSKPERAISFSRYRRR